MPSQQSVEVYRVGTPLWYLSAYKVCLLNSDLPEVPRSSHEFVVLTYKSRFQYERSLGGST